MKNYKIIIYALFVGIIASSCTTYRSSYRLTDIPNNKVKLTKLVADVNPDFDKRVNATSNSFKGKRNIENAKNNAYYRAILENDLDVVVDPIYEIEINKGLFSTTVIAEITGYAGYYKNPRPLDEEISKRYYEKIDALKKLLSIDAITKEEAKTILITVCSEDGGYSKELDTSPTLIEKFNSLYKIYTDSVVNEKSTETKTTHKKSEFLKIFKSKE